MLREAAVEAESEFVEIELQVRRCDGTLVGTDEPAFEQRDNEMNMGKLSTRSLTACCDNVRAMPESYRGESAVNRQAVGDDCCAGFDVVAGKRLDNGLTKSLSVNRYS